MIKLAFNLVVAGILIVVSCIGVCIIVAPILWIINKIAKHDYEKIMKKKGEPPDDI